MSGLAEDVSGRVAFKLLVFDPRQQLVCSRAKDLVRCKMVDKRIRVKKEVVMGRKIGKGYGASSSSNSTSASRRSNSSLVPFQPMMPYAFRIGLSGLLTAMRTLSPSFQGSGSEGFKTPFS